VLINIRNAVLTRRDVKNEGTSGDVYENKGERDNMSCSRAGFLQKIPGFCGGRGETRALLTGKDRIVGSEAEKCAGDFTQHRLRLLRVTAEGSGRHHGSFFPSLVAPRSFGSPPEESAVGQFDVAAALRRHLAR
jgi:hypothetical protein